MGKNEERVFTQPQTKRPMSAFYRFLTPSETSFTYCNEQSPLSVIIAIFYKGEVSPDRVRSALDQLQNRHPFLQCRIKKKKHSYFFEKIHGKAPLPLHVLPRSGPLHWKDKTEQFLNTKFNTKGPLLQVCLLSPDPVSLEGEILLNIHHALIDGHSARLLLSEFLQILGGMQLEDPPRSQLKQVSYPKAFQNWPGFKKRLRFMAAELANEMKFMRRGLSNKIPAKDHNAILSLELDRATSTKLLRRTGDLGISPNSLINAALLHAFYKSKNELKPRLLRTVSFADMRNKMIPRVDTHEMGCHIAMARFTVPVSSKSTSLSIAQDLWKRMFLAGKKGDLYAFSQLGTPIMKVSFFFQQFRLANTALSYIGPLNLQRAYGPVQLLNIRAYITNNRLGPSVTAFGKYLFGKISLDLNYLTSEYEEGEIEEMITDIKASLQDIT